MVRSQIIVAGFNPRTKPVASPRLIKAVAASLVFAALFLCVGVGMTLMGSAAACAI